MIAMFLASYGVVGSLVGIAMNWLLFRRWSTRTLFVDATLSVVIAIIVPSVQDALSPDGWASDNNVTLITTISAVALRHVLRKVVQLRSC